MYMREREKIILKNYLFLHVAYLHTWFRLSEFNLQISSTENAPSKIYIFIIFIQLAIRFQKYSELNITLINYYAACVQCYVCILLKIVRMM